MARIAFFTLGVLHGPGDDPRGRGFFERTDRTFAAAAGSPGFIATAEGGDPAVWGVPTQPARFAAAEFTGRVVQTLTLWHDLPAVFAFAYTGAHAEALSQRQAWFVKQEWPGSTRPMCSTGRRPESARPLWRNAGTRRCW